MSKTTVEVKGLREAQKNIDKALREMTGTTMVKAMRDSTLIVTRDARKNAPVDTGRLRASIIPEVSVEDNIVTGVVGSNVTYAPYVELGTRPHWPPINALKVWARRHHMNAFLVARAISQKGTPAVHYLQRAFDDNRDRVQKRIQQAVDAIVKVANG